MPKQPTLEELAAAYQAQQAAAQAGGQKKEKKKNLVQTVNESFKTAVHHITNIPAYAAKGVNYAERFSSSFIRTSVPMTYATVAALPLLALNPLGAAGVGLVTFGATYLTTNTLYKFVRDMIYLPKYLYTTTVNGLKKGVNPFKIIGSMITLPFKAPFMVLGAAIKYPFKSARRYGPVRDKDGNVGMGVIGGESKLGRNLGLIAGPAAGLYFAGGFSGLSEIVSAAKDKIAYSGSKLYEAAQPYLPNLRLKDGTPLYDCFKSMYSSAKEGIGAFADYSKSLMPAPSYL